MSNRLVFWMFLGGAMFLALCVTWPCLLVPAYALGAETDVIKPVTQGDWTVVEWPYVTSISTTASMETQTRVFGQFIGVYHEPSADHPSATTFELAAKPFFGYGRGYYDTDLLAGKNVGTSTTGELNAYPIWPTSNVPVSSKLRFELPAMSDAGGDPAEGRLIIVFGPK